MEDGFIKVYCIYKLMPFIMTNTLLIDKHEHFLMLNGCDQMHNLIVH
jgi:hypothetical protein